MKGNDKIAFTGEAVALMRAHKNSDRFSKYFVSAKTHRRFKVAKLIVPNAYLDSIFQKRVNLSRDLDEVVKSYNPGQIIELACGYSTRGLIMTQKDPSLVYIETDFPAVIDRKRKILRQIESAEGIKLSKNHQLVGIDAIDQDLYNSLKEIISRKKRTLVIAETLTSYLNPAEHDFLIQNVERLLDKVEEGAYLAHEAKSRLLGFFGKLLLFYRDRIAKTKSHTHFASTESIERHFLGRGSKKVKIVDSEKSNNTLYLAVRK